MGPRRLSRRAARGLVAAAALAALSAVPAGAAEPIFTGPCPQYGDQEVCSGQVASFDGTSLDVDLTKPSGGGGGRHPLMVMLHGFGGDNHEWESTTTPGAAGKISA